MSRSSQIHHGGYNVGWLCRPFFGNWLCRWFDHTLPFVTWFLWGVVSSARRDIIQCNFVTQKLKCSTGSPSCVFTNPGTAQALDCRWCPSAHIQLHSCGMLLAIVAAYLWTKIFVHSVLAVFIITRPPWRCCWDFLDKPLSKRWLEPVSYSASAALLLAIAVLVFISSTRSKQNSTVALDLDTDN